MVATSSAYTQMAQDALPFMSEAQKIALAIEIVRDVRLSSSAGSLTRLSRFAKDTAFNLEAERMVDDRTEHPMIDPDFSAIFFSFYNKAECPAFARAYRQAVRFTGSHRKCCAVPTERRMRLAAASMAFPLRAHGRTSEGL